jgi:hypothetical protein
MSSGTHQFCEKLFIPQLLAHHRGLDDLLDGRFVTHIVDLVTRQCLQNLESFFEGQLVTVGDFSRLEPHPQKLLGLFEQSTGKNNDEVGAIADLVTKEKNV